ncbi:MAG: sugar ABC transporter ATP-binding protein [Rhodobacteraceae bacterium]|nr:sugar ABC transporter ATP-binding protein [Paracoccaceae bacterium]
MALPALTATSMTKRFGPFVALHDIDFSLEPGEIHALLGVNGAGKSTFIKILSGIHVKDGGRIELAGREVHFHSPQDAIRAGIATVQQHPELVPDISGYENIFLGRESEGGSLFARMDRKALERRGQALLKRFPVEIDLSRKVGEMPAVEREIVAILQALAGEHIRVLILDEPTSTLTEVEKDILFRLMANLRESGIAIIYITHRLDEVYEIADRFSVFRGGRRVATVAVTEAREKRLSLAELMLGETLGEVFPEKNAAPSRGEAVLEVRGLARAGAFEDLTFTARRGEILGVFGLVGSGIDELSKVLFGAMPPDRGAMRLLGHEASFASPSEALARGIFLVPGDRRSEGLTLSRSSIFNMTLAKLDKASRRGGLMRRPDNLRAARRLAEEVTLQPPDIGAPVGRFSGGNQQKVVIAKGLYTEAELYIFVEPTVGVDIGARSRIYGLMRELSRKAAVIVMSTDCDEVFGLADRTIALYRGKRVPAPEDMPRGDLLMAGILGEAHT